MSWLSKPIKDGVTAGLTKALGPGGAFAKAMDAAFVPVRAEMARLRAIEALYRWRAIKSAPRDGSAVLVARCGDILWAAWMVEDGCGYWDSDVEYGGSPIEPPPTHWFQLPPAPVPAAPPAASFTHGKPLAGSLSEGGES